MKRHRCKIPNLDVIIDKEDIIIISKNKLECLSNAAVNGGRLKTDSIVNHHVSLDFKQINLKEVLKPIKAKFNLSDSMIGLFTAVEFDELVAINEKVDDIDYTIFLTAGLTNVTAPPLEVLQINEQDYNSFHNFGTINIILVINAKLTEHAVVTLFISITEAKTYLLNMLNIRTNDGKIATGTSTDTIVIGFTNEGQLIEWSGYATKFGQSIGYTVFKALNIALRDKRGG